jgi:methionine sulfoxide reductase heme-binding subunit
MARIREVLASILKARLTYAAVFAACLVPGVVIGWKFYRAAAGIDPEALGANPVETLLHTFGRWALTMLLITLSVTPVRRLTGLNTLQRFRRTLGLWSFTYALLHLLTYLIFNQNCYSFETCDWDAIGKDLIERKFIFVGMFTFTILLILALTSTDGWVRRLKKNWGRLHRLVYVAAVTGLIHFAWGQKEVITTPLRWAGILTVLFAIRLYFAIQKRRRARAPARPVTA